jgi:2-polyprenyl-3-methyl-5-hydroxy-6-metoxy-1,4-benzoquinol methylase
VLSNPHRRWWNHHWSAYSSLIEAGVHGNSTLAIGCGEGFEAIRLAKLGDYVQAFDLSPDMLRVAEERAEHESVQIDFREMAAETLSYRDSSLTLSLPMTSCITVT